jgi:hypothetical protein
MIKVLWFAVTGAAPLWGFAGRNAHATTKRNSSGPPSLDRESP